MTSNTFTVVVSVDAVTEPPIEPPVEPPAEGLTAKYVVPSGPHAGTYVYSEAGGDGQTVEPLDAYVDPDGDFTMSCTAVVRSDAPMQVIFRRVEGWACIIFECCDALATTNQHMMPDTGDHNTVTISDQSGEIEVIQMWGQWALGRWRWQSGTWPFPKDPARLRDRKLLPLFDANVLSSTPPPVPAYVEYAPMHLPKGYPLYVGGGGDPLLLSTDQGYWGYSPTAETLANMLRQAEGLGAYPWFIRDNTTWSVPNIWSGPLATRTTWMPNNGYSQQSVEVRGKPGTAFGGNAVTDERGLKWSFTWQGACIVDSNGYFKAGIQHTGYPGASEPAGPFTIDNVDITSVTKIANTFMQGCGLIIDEAHSGSMWPFPWIATGDPYYLEALHAKYVFVYMSAARPIPRPKLSYSQIRQTAWQLTSLMISAVTTPENAPSWLLPRALWQQLWEDEKRLWDSELVHGTTPGSTVFHTVGVTAGGAQGGPWLAPWQEDMILQVTSWAAMLMPECKWMAEWKAADQIARTNGTSGWCQFYPETYYQDVGPANGQWYPNWGTAWSENQKNGKVVSPTPTTLTSSADYCGQLRAGMAFATQADIATVKAPLASLTTNMKAVHYTDGWNRLFAVKG